VLYFERLRVLRSIQADPAVAEFFLVLLANKCILLNERIETLNLRTVRQRLAQYLLAHCATERSCDINLTIKKSELAKYLGTISETLSRTFRRMGKDGLIEVRGRHIHVLDCARLRQELNR
jgi:CRP/FNR family transcriptional regulator